MAEWMGAWPAVRPVLLKCHLATRRSSAARRTVSKVDVRMSLVFGTNGQTTRGTELAPSSPSLPCIFFRFPASSIHATTPSAVLRTAGPVGRLKTEGILDPGNDDEEGVLQEGGGERERQTMAMLPAL